MSTPGVEPSVPPHMLNTQFRAVTASYFAFELARQTMDYATCMFQPDLFTFEYLFNLLTN